MNLKFSWKIWILIIFLLFSITAIFITPNGIAFFQKGVVITSVEKNSTAFEQGLRQGQIIVGIDDKKVDNIDDFSKILLEKYTSNKSVKTIIKTKKAEVIIFSKKFPEITVSEIPKTNIKTGLDLAGGARALIKAKDKELSFEEVTDLVDITSNRLNAFGLTDIKVTSVSDLSGNNFMLVEIAGATPKDLKNILSKQGKFEAKIGNETVFTGGERDIASVGRNAQNSYVQGCQQVSQNKWQCSFRFSVFLSPRAAERHAEITSKLDLNKTNPEYLSKKLDLYLDDNLVDSLLIGKELKGQAQTQISISGPGSGTTEEEAFKDAQEEMHRLQTILITGSLPYKLEIVKLDTISPLLGEEFINSILFAGLAALVAVMIIIFARYRSFKFSFAILISIISEVTIILGIAAFIDWNLDLPSIAGILATIGTGIDDLVIILDESTHRAESLSMKQRMKRAFAIILGAYFTSLVSLLPLIRAGAGLLKGFAITTLIGITIGVLITRPAFADIVKRIEKK